VRKETEVGLIPVYKELQAIISQKQSEVPGLFSKNVENLIELKK
jgi:hypothetical protein